MVQHYQHYSRLTIVTQRAKVLLLLSPQDFFHSSIASRLVVFVFGKLHPKRRKKSKSSGGGGGVEFQHHFECKVSSCYFTLRRFSLFCSTQPNQAVFIPIIVVISFANGTVSVVNNEDDDDEDEK